MGFDPKKLKRHEWITDELLKQHAIVPYALLPLDFISFTMNTPDPKPMDLYEIGKWVQRNYPDFIPWRCQHEVAAGYWQHLRWEIGLDRDGWEQFQALM